METKKSDFSIIYFMVALAVMFVAQYFLLAKQLETISYSQFKTLLKKGQVAEVVVRDKTIGGSIKSEGLKEIFRAEKIKELGEGAKKPVPFLVVRVEDPATYCGTRRSRDSVQGRSDQRLVADVALLGCADRAFLSCCGIFCSVAWAAAPAAD